MKRALAVVLLLLAGAVATFFLWPQASDEPARTATEGAYSPAPERTTGSAIVRPGTAKEAAGKVVDGRGRGIPGALVFLAREGAESMSDERCDCPVCQKALLECACSAGAAQVASLVARREGELQADKTAQADKSGEFRIADPPAGLFLIWANAPGFAPAFRHGVEAGTRVELALGASQALFGKVVDEADQPIAGALLTDVFSLLPRFSETTSGADGGFRIEGLGLGPHFLVATAKDFLPGGAPLSVPTGAPVTLTLARPRALEGTVHDHQQVAKNVHVRLNADHFGRLVPAPQGTFRLESLAPGTYTVTATAGRRFASAQVDLTRPVTHVDLSLDEALSLRGRVFDDAGEAVGGANVAASLDGRRLADTRSDAAGAFAMDGIPSGSRLTAWREGYEASSVRVGEGADEVELVLHAQAAVSGVVVSPQGEPLPQVQIIARGAGRGVAISDASGAFKMALQSGGPVTLLAHHSTYGAGEVSVEAPASGVKLKLSTMGAVRARLVDGSGKPIPGGKASAWKDDPALQRFDTFSSDVPSGEDGLVILAGLPAGPHRVRFTAKGFQSTERRNVPVPESGELDLGDVALEAGKEIAGVVLKDDGSPALGAFVHARAKGSRATEGVQTGKDGSFNIGGLKEGSYSVSAFLDKAVAEASARTGDRNVVLRLPAAARLRGRVLEAGGRPLARFSVDGTAVEAVDGRFEVAARAWRDNVFFRVSADGHLTAFKQARLGADNAADAGDVILERALSIAGVVQDEAGNKVSGAAVLVSEREQIPAQDETPARAVSGEGGHFRLEGFSPGPVALIARRGTQVAEKTVMLEEDDASEVVLVLHGKGAIEGQVRGADGKPVVAELHTRNASTTSDSLGRYKLDGLVPGSYLVLAVLDADTFRSASHEVTVSAGSTARLDFDLGASATLRVTVQGATTGSLHLMRADPTPAGGIRATASQTAQVVQGQAVVSGLQEGRYNIFFYGQTSGREESFAEGTVDVPASGTVQAVLTVRP